MMSIPGLLLRVMLLLCAAGGFRARTNQIRQIVFSIKGLPERYLPRDIR